MPVHQFGGDPALPSAAERSSLPNGAAELPGARQSSHVEGGRTSLDGSDFMAYPYHLEEFLQPGFRALDDAMKQFWSGIRVPTKNSYRFMRVKIAGGDKSLLTWADDLKEGRVRLPLAALDRSSHEFNPEKFSPAYHAMTARYVNKRGSHAAKVYRPVPFLVDYNLTVWAEHKRDAEYILYQILTRFNPLAEFRMFDGKLEGNVQLRYGGCQDASDKETGYDQQANIRYEITTTAEAWLPLPEKIVPTVLGRVTLLREKLGEILVAAKGSAISANKWTTPSQDLS